MENSSGMLRQQAEQLIAGDDYGSLEIALSLLKLPDATSKSHAETLFSYCKNHYAPTLCVTTRFFFSINPTSFGDGLAFFLSPNNQTLGSPGGYLGLVNSFQLTKNKFIAIEFEFDTYLDSHFNDPNENPIGLDIDSLNSIKTVDPFLQGVDLKSGNSITAWIDYKNDLREFLYVGFSASKEGSTELHLIDNWSFQTSGFLPVRPRSHPHNVSDNSVVTITPSIPLSDSTNKHHKRIGLGLGIAGPTFFCVALKVFGYMSVKKWKGIRTEKSFKAELLTGAREFSYRELKSATRGFHSSRIVGYGAFGTVYKACFISTGTISAVKRSKHTHEGKTEFLAELSIIACLRHTNLVQFQGWCVEKGEPRNRRRFLFIKGTS